MNKYYCPHCGFANNPNNHFCKHCGFNLKQYKQQHLQDHDYSGVQQSKPNINVNRSSVPPQQPLRRPMNYYPPRRHHWVSWLLSVIAVVILIFVGIGAYSNDVWPFGSGPIGQIMGENSKQSANSNDNNTQSNNSNSGPNNNANSSNNQNNSNDSQNSSSDYTPIKILWKHVNNKLNSDNSNGGSTEIDDLFQDSDDNSSLDGIKDWLNLMVKANHNNDTEVTDIKPYDFSSSNGEIHYKVRYDFKLHAHSDDAYHHIQIFDWHATVQDGKIGLMKSPKTPAEDYKE